MENNQSRIEHLDKIAKLMFDKKWDGVTKAEQEILDIRPNELQHIFVALDKLKNQVSTLS